MKRKSREEQFFGFNPVSIVNDFNQAANDYTTDQMDSLESFLKGKDLSSLEKKDIKKASKAKKKTKLNKFQKSVFFRASISF